MKKNTDLQRLADIYMVAFEQLGVSCTKPKAKKLAKTIQSAMSAHGRNYHNLDHVFSFVDPDDPIITLAAMYHDVVYYQVDQGFTPEVLKIIIPSIYELEGEFYISNNIPEKDSLVWMTMAVFGLKPGQKLNSVDALNEFLSALVMVKEIGGVVNSRDLLKMTVCIEATIPFRPRDKKGQTPYEAMGKRLKRIARKFCSTPMTSRDIENIIKIAVVFANKDIGNFSESDPARFLDNTWKLLPETNVSLRNRQTYSIRSYRIALQKMRNFMMFLEPEIVFGRYHGVPDDKDYLEMESRARANILVARDYLRIRLVTIAILEALAQSSGGDTPLSIFMGDLSDEAGSGPRIEDYLPDIPTPSWVDRAPVIRDLLEVGRASESNFDTRNSRLSLFVFKSLSPKKMAKSFERTQEFFAGKLDADGFLASQDRALVAHIAEASASMVLIRRDKLIKFGGGR